MKAKDAGLRIRVDRGLRDDFVEACRSLDKPAAQVLREFMRRFIEEQAGSAAQQPRPKRLKKTT
ncbi:MAG: hypothetical protein ACREDT_01520 [Methylocella sp.]